MRKTAAGLIAAGFVFAYFSLPLFGIDLLLDPVGYVLVFNGLRVFQKRGRAFGVAVFWCLGLVALSAAQLFVGGAAAGVLQPLRTAADLVLFLLMIGGFCPMLRGDGWLWDAGLFFMVFLAGVVYNGLVLIAALSQKPPRGVSPVAGVVVHLLLLLPFARLFFVGGPAHEGK